MTDVPDLDRFHREAVEEGRQQIIANRWAAFTDDELRDFRDALGYVMGGGPELLGRVRDFTGELEHEIERRRS